MVCGHFKSWIAVKDLWINFRSMYKDVDVFIHTWKDAGVRSIGTGKWVDPNASLEIPIDEITKIIKPVSYIVDDIKLQLKCHTFRQDGLELYYSTTGLRKDTPPDDFSKYVFTQLYSIYHANRLVRTEEDRVGYRYDLVVRMRADFRPILPSCATNFDLINGQIYWHTTLFVNSSQYHRHPGGGGGCKACADERTNNSRKHVEHTNNICDAFYFGSSRMIEITANMYLVARNLVVSFDKYNKEAMSNKDISSRVTYLPNYQHYSIHHTLLETGIKCFYPERMLQEYLKDYWVVSEPFCTLLTKLEL